MKFLNHSFSNHKLTRFYHRATPGNEVFKATEHLPKNETNAVIRDQVENAGQMQEVKEATMATKSAKNILGSTHKTCSARVNLAKDLMPPTKDADEARANLDKALEAQEGNPSEKDLDNSHNKNQADTLGHIDTLMSEVPPSGKNAVSDQVVKDQVDGKQTGVAEAGEQNSTVV